MKKVVKKDYFLRYLFLISFLGIIAVYFIISVGLNKGVLLSDCEPGGYGYGDCDEQCGYGIGDCNPKCDGNVVKSGGSCVDGVCEYSSSESCLETSCEICEDGACKFICVFPEVCEKGECIEKGCCIWKEGEIYYSTFMSKKNCNEKSSLKFFSGEQCPSPFCISDDQCPADGLPTCTNEFLGGSGNIERWYCNVEKYSCEVETLEECASGCYTVLDKNTGEHIGAECK